MSWFKFFIAAFLFSKSLLAVTHSECVVYLSNLAYSRWAGGSYTLDDGERAFHRKYRNDPTFANWILNQESLSESPPQLLERFKNEKVPEQSLSPRQWDLTNYGKYLPSITGDTRPMHGALYYLDQARRFIPLFRSLSKRSPYDEAVLSLRKGDEVKFGDKEFTLGDFVGSGNSTFIFRLEGKPGKVIRIPFLVAPLKSAGLHPEIFNLLTRFRRPNPEIPQVKLYETGRGFSVVSEVDGNENGNEFLISIRRRYLSQMSSDMQRFFEEFPEENISWATSTWYLEVERLTLRERDLETFQRLQSLRRRVNQLQSNALGLKFLIYSRQFVWDRQLKDWVLVDWE